MKTNTVEEKIENAKGKKNQNKTEQRLNIQKDVGLGETTER